MVSLLGPALLTRDTAVLWWLNAAVVALCYLYAYTTQSTASNDGTLMLGTTLGGNEKAVSAVAGDVQVTAIPVGVTTARCCLPGSEECSER